MSRLALPQPKTVSRKHTAAQGITLLRLASSHSPTFRRSNSLLRVNTQASTWSLRHNATTPPAPSSQLQTLMGPRADLRNKGTGVFPTEQAQSLKRFGLQRAGASTLDSALNCANYVDAQYIAPSSGKANAPDGNHNKSARTPRSFIKGRRQRKLHHLPAAQHDRVSAGSRCTLGSGRVKDELPNLVSEQQHCSRWSSEELDEQFDQIISTMSLSRPPRASDSEEQHHAENDGQTPSESLEAFLQKRAGERFDRLKTKDVIRDLQTCMLKAHTSIESADTTAGGFEDDVQDLEHQ